MSRILTFLILSAAQANAGAWLRDPGEVFLSFSVEAEVDAPANGYVSAYAEYGMRRSLTLGLDFGGNRSGGQKAVGFIRWPLDGGDGPWRLAAEAGLGLIDGSAVLRPGLSAGYGFAAGAHGGWLAFDSRATIGQGGLVLWETESTLGLRMSDHRAFMLQLSATALPDGEDHVRMTPSLLLGRETGRQIELGVAAGLAGDDRLSLKFALWRRF